MHIPTSAKLEYSAVYHHPFINSIVNPADILPVNGIPKLVIANEEEAVVAAWISLLQIIIITEV